MARTFATCFFLFAYLQACRAQLKSCYFSDLASSNDYPCNPEADVSSCCGHDWICKTNLFCESQHGDRIIGTCTDRSWGDPACPYTLNIPITHSNHDPFNYKANITVCGDGTVCPNNNFSTTNTTCCNEHQGRNEINFHNDAIIPKDVSDLPDYYSAAGYTIPSNGVYITATSSTAHSSSTSSPSTTTSGTSSNGVTPDPLPITASSSNGESSSSGLSSGAKAGIGIGIAAAALAVAGLAIFFWMRRRKARKNGGNPVIQQDMGGYYKPGVENGEAAPIYSGYMGELPAEGKRTELDSGQRPEVKMHEMQG